MADQRLMINNMPLRGGLATAGQRSTINESQLWRAINTYPDLDGMTRRRPGLVQYGQTLKIPADITDGRYHETFSTLGGWSVSTSGNATSSATVSLGRLTLALAPEVTTPTASAVVLSRTSSDVGTGGDVSFRFSARLINPSGDDTTGGKFRIKFSSDAVTPKVYEVAMDADGVYVVEGGSDVLKYTPTYKLDLGGYHTYEFYYVLATNTLDLWVDDEQVLTAEDMSAADSNISYVGSSVTLELVATLGTTEDAWTVNVADLMYSDAVYDADALPFVAKRIVDVGQYDRIVTGGAKRSSLLAATNEKLYADVDTVGVWRPILNVQPGHTFMLSYQNTYLLFDDNGLNSSRLFAWDGVNAPEQVDDAPPVRFGSAHRTRLWGGGDRAFPLRAYFTASRQYDVWFAPEYDSDETFEEVLNAGYIEMPSETGDEIVGLYGEFFGSLIVETVQGWWRITGSSPQSFQVENISKKVGGAAPNGMVQLGNDLLGVGHSGVSALSTAQTYGDLQMAMPSGAIADKWSSIPSISDRVDRAQLYDSYFDALPSLNVAILGMRGQGSTVLDKMFAYSPLTKQWYGPWDINCTCFTQIEYGVPTTELLMHGHENGKVTFTGLNVWDDVGESYSCTISTPMLNGRSLGVDVMHLRKTWATCRLWVLPRVNQTFTIKWRTDEYEFDSEERSQDPADGPSLSDDYRLDVDLLGDANEVVMIEITLDARGTYIHFDLTSDYEFILQGYQVEFEPGNEED